MVWIALLLTTATPIAAQWSFVEVAEEAGITLTHVVRDTPTEAEVIASGVAAGDVDRDGWPDLYVVGGLGEDDVLLRNRGHEAPGTFEVLPGPSSSSPFGPVTAGPTLADTDGDGWLDLVIGNILGGKPQLFRNQGAGARGLAFEVVEAGFYGATGTYSSALGDYDRDGDLDIFFSHWFAPMPTPHLWRNDGDNVFVSVDDEAGITPAYPYTEYSFTPNFTDFDGDGWPDLLVAGDFGDSQVFRNQGDGTFTIETDAQVITDENGMGAAIGDYDNDGDLDWFVTSIWDPDGMATGNWGVSGNRLYRNDGTGAFEDATDEAGVRQGYWGWGTCFADFDLDGHLDIFHTNGFSLGGTHEFFDDPARLFLSNGDGSFREEAALRGIDDTGQGRGVVCFDYDRDGDVDVFVANNDGPALLYRNDQDDPGNFLHVTLRGTDGNTQGIGAWVTIEADGHRQLQEIRAGSQYASQSPAVAHFGLGDAPRVDRLEIRWPDGTIELHTNLTVNRHRTFTQGSGPTAIPSLNAVGLGVLIALLMVAGCRRLRSV